MRERGGIWIAHGDGSADRGGRRRERQGARAARRAVLPASPALARAPAVPRLLRRLRQRGAVAALPSGRRPAAVPQRGLGGLSGGQRPVRGGDRRRAAQPTTRRSSSRTTTWRWSRSGSARAGRRRGRRCSGTSRGRTRTGCASARGGASCSRACSPTICSRSSSNAIAATFCWRSRRSSTPTSKPRRTARFVSDRVTTAVTAVPIGVDYDRIQAVGARHGASPSSRSGCASRLRPAGRAHRPGRRSPRLHEGHSRAARSARPAVHAAAGAARPPHVRADRRPVTVGARQLQRDRVRDRSQGRRAQRAPWRAGAAAAGLLPQGGARIWPAWSRSIASRTSASSARCTTA